MADEQRRRRREAPATLADALGSHAASAGAQRQQALARAASLLKMKPKIGSSARSASLHLGGPGAAAPAAAPAARSAGLRPPARRHAAGRDPGAEEPQQSVHGGSTHVQPQPVGARAPTNENQQQPAASTHSSADGAGRAAGGQTSGYASGHEAGTPAARPAAAAAQQWGGSTDPSSYFAQARSFLLQLAASRNGLGTEALSAAPDMLLQKLEGRTEGLAGPSASQQQLPPPPPPQAQRRDPRPQPQQPQQPTASQQPVLAPSNVQRASTRSCSGAASLSTKQHQSASQAVWQQPGEGQRQSSKAARPSGSTTRFPPSSMQPGPGQVPRSSGTLLLPGSMMCGSFGGAGGGGGAAGGIQRQLAGGHGGAGRWGLSEEEEEDGPAAGLAGSHPRHLRLDLPNEQPRSSPGWLVGQEDAAEDRLLAAAPSSGSGRWQEASGPLVRSYGAAGEAMGQLGAGASDDLDGLFRTAKRQRLGQQGQQAGGEALEGSWWGAEPEQAHATGWDSWEAGGPAPSSDFGALQQDGPWQLSPGGQTGRQQLGWSLLDQEEPGLTPQLDRPEGALRHGGGERQQQQQQPRLGKLLPAEPLPAFLAPSPKVQRQQQQKAQGWEAGGLERLGSGWGAAGSGSDELPAFFL